MRKTQSIPRDVNFVTFGRKLPKGFGVHIGFVKTKWEVDHPRNMVLARSIDYYDPNGVKWTAPAGSIIDGASTGWFLRRVFPAYVGWYRRATVFHDVYCEKRTVPSRAVHRMFYQAMRCDGTHPIVAWLLWFGVRVFGPKFDGLPAPQS